MKATLHSQLCHDVQHPVLLKGTHKLKDMWRYSSDCLEDVYLIPYLRFSLRPDANELCGTDLIGLPVDALIDDTEVTPRCYPMM